MEAGGAAAFEGQSQSGLGLDPWDVPCVPNQEFVEETRLIHLPGTSSVSVSSLCRPIGCSSEAEVFW